MLMSTLLALIGNLLQSRYRLVYAVNSRPGHRPMNLAQPIRLVKSALVEHLGVGHLAPGRRRILRKGLPAGGLGAYGSDQSLNLDQVAERGPPQQSAVGLEPTDALAQSQQLGPRPGQARPGPRA